MKTQPIDFIFIQPTSGKETMPSGKRLRFVATRVEFHRKGGRIAAYVSNKHYGSISRLFKLLRENQDAFEIKIVLSITGMPLISYRPRG